MSRRNVIIAVAVVAAIAIALFMYFWVWQAPTERNLEGLGTELEEAGEQTMVEGPEDPPEPEPSNVPPSQ
jgi:hypothetical protein